MEQKIRILVLDRGFVMVCRCTDPQQYGLWLTVFDARIIRAWGTTNGLAELCKGPTSSTRLDAMVEQETIPSRAILRILEVEQSPWEQHLKQPSQERSRRGGR